MNENLNLCEILKGLEDIELYSTIYGIVKFKKINISDKYPIKFTDKEGKIGLQSVTKDGKHYVHTKGECTLFPSKEQRDWSKFKKPIPEGTPMMCKGREDVWMLKYYKCYKIEEDKHYVKDVVVGESFYSNVIPYDEFNPNDIGESLKHDIQSHLFPI